MFSKKERVRVYHLAPNSSVNLKCILQYLRCQISQTERAVLG